MNVFINKLYIWSRSQKNRDLLIQFIFVIFVGLFFYYLASKARLLDMTLSHFSSRAGFGISHTFIIDYTSNDSRWVSYFTGVINTIRVCIVAILFASLLGTIMGVARLSKNILFSTISYLYVEILRNTPLLIQIIFWQIIFLKLPRISEALTFGNTVVISNRGILLPSVTGSNNGNIWIILIIISIILALIVSYIVNKREDVEGKNIKLFNLKINGNLIGILLFFTLTISTYFILQQPYNLDLPSIYQNNKGTFLQSGGFEFTPEFGGILFALVMYTGTFITEIVRGSIQSLSKGQTEAAQALGLSNYQTMTLIVLPQALRSIIPPLTNQYLNLTKNSSLSVVIAYPELFMVSRTIMNNAGHALPVFFLILITYLSLSLAISMFMNIINRRVTRIGT
ncbi:MAG: polar amino acid ABC transporter permease [Chloroflexi bacterium]|nr:polar amino acid ABC transporter permease [Chloroflexota bacterium]|tara:strand:+ start:37 stop:1227 length:1191 start_codon:yes stop_codon:yes gene_type:complete